MTLVVAAVMLGAADAKSRCRVVDPSGTPLNVRTMPQGRIIDTLPNDMLVTVLDETKDQHGKAWVFVASYENDLPLGWVFRNYISCF